MMRRALARGDVEALVSGARAEQVLPPLYLVLPAEEDGGLDLFVTAYLVRVRENGFMVILPDLEAVRARLDALVNDEGESIPLQRRDQVQAETVRGRQLGPGRVILADFPWSGCEFFVKPTALRGMTDRASRVLTLSVGDVVARPSAADAQDTAGRWIDQLDPDTAQEYWASANDGVAEEEEAPDEEVPLAPPHHALPARTLPVAARASQANQARPGGLFQASRGLSTAELDRLRNLAGGPPARTGTLERNRAPPNPPPEGGLHLEGEFGALPPPEVQDPAAELMDSTSTLQTLLLAQMRQNAVLLEKLASGKHGDGIQEALAGAGGSGSESSSGIKGHLAREAFVKQVSDCKLVAAKVQENAMTELGLSATEPGMMRTYLEQRVPLADHRLLQHVAALAAFGWEMGYKAESDELKGFCSRLLLFVEQAALDSGKVQLAYLLAGFPDPSPVGFAHRRAPGLKTFSRLAAPQWLAANLAYLKDLDYAETRIQQMATARPPNAPPKVTSADQSAEPNDDAEKPPRRPPRRPKNTAS